MTSYALFLLLSLTPTICFLMGAFFAHKFLLQEVHVLSEEMLDSFAAAAPSYTGPTQWESEAPCLTDLVEDEWTDTSLPRAA